MFILSQDKCTFFNADNTKFVRAIKDAKKGNMVVAYIALRSDDKEWSAVLGRYETFERSQEVFEEICAEILSGENKVYEMPEA